jgi:hypothetical protein
MFPTNSARFRQFSLTWPQATPDRLLPARRIRACARMTQGGHRSKNLPAILLRDVPLLAIGQRPGHNLNLVSYGRDSLTVLRVHLAEASRTRGAKMTLFQWTTFDVRSLLPRDWSEQLVDAAGRLNRRKRINPPHVTSREAAGVKELVIRGVGSQTVASKLPWLMGLYHAAFRDLAQRTTVEPVSAAVGDRHTVVLNVQTPDDMRYECHVDTNPIQGLLYVTSHPAGSGGELVVGNNTQAGRVEEVEEDCSIIYPQSGHLLFFDGRYNPHYIRPLLERDHIRVAVAMNYYVPSVPESLRPPDLDDYLFGTLIE